MKRTKSLVASILGTTVTGIQVIATFYVIFLYMSLISQVTDPEAKSLVVMMIGIAVVLELFLITSLVLSCVTFGHVNGSPEKYEKRRGVTIATIVFNFLVVIMFIASCFESDAGTIVFALICAAALVAANVLYIMDLTQEKARVEKFNKEQENPITEPVKVEAVKTEEVKVVTETTPETKEEK